MSGERELFTKIEEAQDGYVTFGDGNIVKILGVGTIVAPGIPQLTEKLYVQGLKHNLISISQICNKGYKVQFGKDECVIKDHREYNILAKGAGTSDNCYVIDPNSQQGNTYLLTQKDETNLWHQILGHLNFRDLVRLSKNGIVKDLPKLSKVNNPICKGCQIRKQTRVSHKKVTSIGTTRALEILHIDLTSPTRNESLGWKKYFMVMFDDFLRYTWVAFLREKSEAFNEFLSICKQIQVEKDVNIKRI